MYHLVKQTHCAALASKSISHRLPHFRNPFPLMLKCFLLLSHIPQEKHPKLEWSSVWSRIVLPCEVDLHRWLLVALLYWFMAVRYTFFLLKGHLVTISSMASLLLAFLYPRPHSKYAANPAELLCGNPVPCDTLPTNDSIVVFINVLHC